MPPARFSASPVADCQSVCTLRSQVEESDIDDVVLWQHSAKTERLAHVSLPRLLINIVGALVKLKCLAIQHAAPISLFANINMIVHWEK